MKAYGGVYVKIHVFLTSALAGGEWSASHPGRFIPGERASGKREMRKREAGTEERYRLTSSFSYVHKVGSNAELGLM
jgi:hypothetical protein